MKQDIELLKNILISIEELQQGIEPLDGSSIYYDMLSKEQIHQEDYEKFAYHVRILAQDNIIEANTENLHAGLFMVNCITPAGHRLLETFSNQSFYQKVKNYLIENSVPLTVSSIQVAANTLISNLKL